MYRSHLQTDHQLRSSCRQDVRRKVNGAWKVRRRALVLDANLLFDKYLSVFLYPPSQYPRSARACSLARQ
jgi:hypothetical protein